MHAWISLMTVALSAIAPTALAVNRALWTASSAQGKALISDIESLRSHHHLARRGGGVYNASDPNNPTFPGSPIPIQDPIPGCASHPVQRDGVLSYNDSTHPPIMANVEVTTLLWGENVSFADELEGFYTIVNSPWWNLLSQYYTPTQPCFGPGTVNPTIDIKEFTTLPTNKSLINPDVRVVLKELVKSGIIQPTANSYYPIHFAPGYNVTIYGAGSAVSCTSFCAYHDTIDISDIYNGTQYLIFGVIPEQTGCGCDTEVFQLNKNYTASDVMYIVASHELAEAATDPAVGAGNVSWIAWTMEIGDICRLEPNSTLAGNGRNYTVQNIFSDIREDCLSEL